MIVTKFKRNIYIYIRELLSLDIAEEESLCTKFFFSLFLFAFSPSLIHCEYCPVHPIHWSLVVSLLSTNSLYWALWTLIHLTFGLGIQNLPLQYIYIYISNLKVSIQSHQREKKYQFKKVEYRYKIMDLIKSYKIVMILIFSFRYSFIQLIFW